MATWHIYILSSFRISFPILVLFTKKNLAAPTSRSARATFIVSLNNKHFDDEKYLSMSPVTPLAQDFFFFFCGQ
jgi:hypothetical protein